ncbi:GP158 protein, partial [Amia calva]|nr:GP158 protein [Amia calva]
MVFQANDIREASVREDIEWYHALVRSLLEGDPKIQRAVLTFDAQPTSPRPQLVLQASRAPGPADILLEDLSTAWERLHMLANGSDWFTALKFPEGRPLATLHKRTLRNDLRTLDTPKWSRGDSYVLDRRHVHWADAPFLDCRAGRFLPGWLVSLSTSFYGLKPDLSPEFRGVIRMDVSLQSLDIDQCATGEDWFSNTHLALCPLSPLPSSLSAQCEPLTGQGFRLGQYQCRCKEGFYSPPNAAGGEEPSRRSASGEWGPRVPVCLPCWPGCQHCLDSTPCSVQQDWRVRAAVLAVQAFFMLLVFISMLVAYRFRRSKRIRASGLLLLETILFGSLLLYFPVFILYFKPSTFRCILLRWVRLLGFAIVYGTVTLKMYRVLRVFVSRTAQRVPYMSSTRVLRMLGVIVLTVSWFLSAWTAGALQNMDRNVPMLVTSQTREGLDFSLCDLDRWDYMMAVAELLFLCWGSVLCHAVRTVPSAFHEPRYMGIAIHNEMLLSAAFHLLRFLMPSLHPDWTLLLFFTHTHVTITVTLGLLFIPKFLHASRPLREEIAAEVYEDELDLRRSGSYLNSSITSAWSEHSLDPGWLMNQPELSTSLYKVLKDSCGSCRTVGFLDHDELKKLYAQLEVHKTKKMTANNPHLQKKRSSRRGLGRSIMKRITEIPESMSRQCSREDKEGAGGTGSQTGSCKKKAGESGGSSTRTKEDSLKQRVLSLRKSHSTYDHVRDQRDHHPRSCETKDSSLLDSLMRRKMAKKASERSDCESVDAAPLVCKSASAHNLTDKRPLQPRASRLQKSMSVMAGPPDTAHLLPSKACSLEDTSQAGGGSHQGRSLLDSLEATLLLRTDGEPPRGLNALLDQDFDRAEVCPWEAEAQLPESKSQKHVTYAFNSNGEMGSHSLQHSHTQPEDGTLRVEELPGRGCMKADLEAPGGGSQAGETCSWDSETDEVKAKVPVSSSAPGSPVSGLVRAKGFSYKGPPRGFGLSMKGLVGSGKGSLKIKGKKGSDKKKEKKEEAGKSKGKGAASQAAPCAEPPVEKHKEGSPTSGESGAALKTDSEAATGSPKSEVCPQGAEEAREPAASAEKCATQADHRMTRQESSVAIVCPWEVEGVKPGVQRQASVVCPWEGVEPPQKTTKRRDSTLTDVSPRDTETVSCHLPQPPVTASEKATKRRDSTLADVCPWEAEGEKPGVRRRSSVVCPWEGVEPPQKTSKQEDSTLEDVCPWEAEGEKPGVRRRSSVVCPWEGVEPPQKTSKQEDSTLEDVCPWEAETHPCPLPEPPVMASEQSTNRRDSTLVDVCPWEDEGEKPGVQRRSSVVCPWEGVEPPQKTSKQQDSTLEDVCPWEAEGEKPGVRRRSSVVCPWEGVEPPQKTSKQQDSTLEDVCPWETETHPRPLPEPPVTASEQSTNRRDSTLADVCPWEAEDTPAKHSEMVCPRPAEGKKPGVQRQASVVCPWEGVEPPQKSTKRRNSTLADVCPWKVPEARPSPAHSTTAEVCPWEAPEPAGGTLPQQSELADVCPWKTQEAERPTDLHSTFAKPSPGGATVTEATPTTQQDSKAAGTSSVTGQPALRDRETDLALARRDALCPWEVEKLRAPRETDDSSSDILPWEAEAEEQSDDPERDAEGCPFLYEPDMDTEPTTQK